MLTNEFIFVAQVVDQESQEVNLLASNSNHKNYDFQQIQTNAKTFREHSYTFLDTSEGTVFLHINHFGENSRYGHIYISDADGLKYSQSLKYNVRSIENQCDFEKVSNI
jgi:Sortilin, neurotensin receptor 3,